MSYAESLENAPADRLAGDRPGPKEDENGDATANFGNIPM